MTEEERQRIERLEARLRQLETFVMENCPSRSPLAEMQRRRTLARIDAEMEQPE